MRYYVGIYLNDVHTGGMRMDDNIQIKIAS